MTASGDTGAPAAMAVGAHPDDIEFMMAGTLLLLAQAGWELHCMHLADGGCGSVTHGRNELVGIRRAEAAEAARRMGATYHPSLVHDLEILYRVPILARLGAVVRQVAPDILLLPSPEDYMEDHMNATRLGVTAAFARGMPNFPTEPPVAPIDREVVLYHALPYGLRDGLRRVVRAGQYADIGPVLDRKRHVLAAHASQKEWLDISQGLDSYLDQMVQLTAEMGAMSGRYRYAEGWRRHSHLGFAAADRDPLGAALGAAMCVDEQYEQGLTGGIR